MAGMNGTSVLILANTGTPSVPAYEVVGYQRDVTIDESSEVIDVSSKNERAQRVLPGRYSGSMSLDALYVPDDEGYRALRAALRNGELILVAIQEDDVVIETVAAHVDSISRAHPDQAESTISISLTFDGMPEEVGS